MCGPKKKSEMEWFLPDLPFQNFVLWRQPLVTSQKRVKFCLEFREILGGGIRYLGFLMRKKNDSEIKKMCMWGRHEGKKKSSISIFWHAKLWGAVRCSYVDFTKNYPNAHNSHVCKLNTRYKRQRLAAAATFEGCGKNRNKPLNCGMTRKPFLSSSI